MQKIQNTETWADFTNWYEKNRGSKKYRFQSINLELFMDLDFEFQSGVFVKYIESKGFYIQQDFNKVTLMKQYNCFAMEPTLKKIVQIFFHANLTNIVS